MRIIDDLKLEMEDGLKTEWGRNIQHDMVGCYEQHGSFEKRGVKKTEKQKLFFKHGGFSCLQF